MISAINTLNFDINTFKGFDIRNIYSLGKFQAKRNLYGYEKIKIKEKNKK